MDRLDRSWEAFEKELGKLISIYESAPTDEHRIITTVLRHVRHSALIAKAALSDAPQEPTNSGPQKLELASIEDVERIVRTAVENKRGWHKTQEPDKPSPDAGNSIDHFQRTGIAVDIIDEAINTYKGFILDDDYDYQTVLNKIMVRMIERRPLIARCQDAPQEPDKPHPHAVWFRYAWFRWFPVDQKLRMLVFDLEASEGFDFCWESVKDWKAKDPNLIAHCQAAARECGETPDTTDWSLSQETRDKIDAIERNSKLARHNFCSIEGGDD